MMFLSVVVINKCVSFETDNNVEMSNMKPANYGAVYMGLYPKLAEVTREHGYALAVHGSLANDFDLICIPWVENPSTPAEVVDAITSKFALKVRGEADTTHHGRVRHPIGISFGTCFIDLSFMPLMSKVAIQEVES